MHVEQLDRVVAVIAERDRCKIALTDLLKQVNKFCEEQGEAEFYTGNALAALGRSDNPVHLKTLAALSSPASGGDEHG